MKETEKKYIERTWESWKILQTLSCKLRTGFRKKGIKVWVNFYKETKEEIAGEIWLAR